jgi:hypothetical protein
MRVTRESLLRIARETVQERSYNDPHIVAAYLTGSVRRAEPMLGGTTDVDLVFVYAVEPLVSREIIRLTPDFHIDLVRRNRERYRSPRELRLDPWMGYEMYDPILLYEREKFFEFVQAGLRAGFEFESASATLQRCRALYEDARRAWLGLSESTARKSGPVEVRLYLEAIYAAANAVAELNGPPLAERRLLLEFPDRASAVGRDGMAAGLLGLLGGGQLAPEKIDTWLPDWQKCFEAASASASSDPRIHAARTNYYHKAIKAMLGSDHPHAALWPLIHTWTLAACAVDAVQIKSWQSAGSDLELLGSAFDERLQGLDHFLDDIDILLEDFAAANGLQPSPAI